jgi:predicted RNA binding protein YcfA (HicA-like mRNA interferase family)
MPKLPRVTSRKLVRALQRAGYEPYRQRGSHLHLSRPGTGWVVTVPMHGGVLSVGLVADIIQQAGLTVDEFRKLLA